MNLTQRREMQDRALTLADQLLSDAAAVGREYADGGLLVDTAVALVRLADCLQTVQWEDEDLLPAALTTGTQTHDNCSYDCHRPAPEGHHHG